jgi:5-methylcytosine-specific restriction endonuclease McrA
VTESARTYRGAEFGVSYAELANRVVGRSGPNGRRLCLWCEKEIAPRRRVWCSTRCSNRFYDATTWSGLRSHVARRDRGVCALCGVDCRALRRLYATLSTRGRAKLALEHAIPKRRRAKTWWDADHIVPIAEGGRHTPDNLRTLCLRCHKAETEALRMRRIAKRRVAEPDWRHMLDRARRLLDGLDG